MNTLTAGWLTSYAHSLESYLSLRSVSKALRPESDCLAGFPDSIRPLKPVLPDKAAGGSQDYERSNRKGLKGESEFHSK